MGTATRTRRKVSAAPLERPEVVAQPALRARVEEIAHEAVDRVMGCFKDGKLPTSAAEFQALEEKLLLAALPAKK